MSQWLFKTNPITSKKTTKKSAGVSLKSASRRAIHYGCVGLAVVFHAVRVCQGQLVFAQGVAIGTIKSAKITEGSGISVSLINSNVFWTHNDGPRDSIYSFRMDGTLLAAFKLGKSVNDVEDIATGPGPKAGTTYLYVGDIGSNNADRDTIQICRVEEPKVDPAWAQKPVSKDFRQVDVCKLKYPDGKYDAEALLVDPREEVLYIATKQVDSSRLYKIALTKLIPGKVQDLEFVRTLPFWKVSGGGVSSDGGLIALRREDFAQAWSRADNESVGEALGRPGTQIPVVGQPDEPNGEGISFMPDGSGYVTLSEGTNQPVYFFQRIYSPGEPPQFLGSPEPGKDGLHLSFRGSAGSIVTVERSADLANWLEIGSILTDGGTSFFTDREGVGTAFYRLLLMPR